jgi:hypothetical protein
VLRKVGGRGKKEKNMVFPIHNLPNTGTGMFAKILQAVSEHAEKTAT